MAENVLIKKLPNNTIGRDFVIGDLHGCFELFETLLKAVDFDTSKDRLFSVGDLIDRGPHSLRCLQLIEQPWFHAVMGNHEAMMLEFFQRYQQTGYQEPEFEDQDYIGFIENGGEWVRKYYDTDNQCMTAEFDHGLKLASTLPLLIVVGEGEARFNIVHAELLRPDYENIDTELWLDADIDQWLNTQTIPDNNPHLFYWGRSIMLDYVSKTTLIEPGLSTTFCGHTPDKQLRQKLSHLCLDTGAYKSTVSGAYGLTIYEFSTGNWVEASYRMNQLYYGNFK